MIYTDGAVLGRSGRPGQAGAAVGGSPWPSGQDCGPPGPREPVAQPGCNGARSKAARVPAEPGTILRLCARLLGAEETKRKCQERVNQTRYSVTITSFSGLLGPRAPCAQAGHLRGGPSPVLGTRRPFVSLTPKLAPGPSIKNFGDRVQALGKSGESWCTGSEVHSLKMTNL